MLRFEGELELPIARAALAEKLSDLRFLVQCIPGAETIKHAAPELAQCVLRPGFAFVRGTLELTLERSELVAGDKLVVRLLSKGIGSSSEVVATLHFLDAAQGSKVQWQAEVTALGGLLKAVPQGLIRGAAQKVIDDAWARIKQAVATVT